MLKLFLFYSLCLFFFSCSVTKPPTPEESIPKITFLDEYVVPYNFQFKNTIVGGLSCIDYNKGREEYYLICDDRSDHNPARFYTAKILWKDNKIDTLIFTDVTFLRDNMGNLYPNNTMRPDPESMRYDATNQSFVWASEGERNADKGIFKNPSIIRIDKNGVQIDTFALPKGFEMNAVEGPRQNGVFEGLTFSGDYQKVFVSTEEPLYQDGPAAGIKDSTAFIRILEYDRKGRNTAQYAYEIEPVAFAPFPRGSFRVNGVSEILWMNENQLLIVERSFSSGRLSCTIKVFLAETTGATNIINTSSLKQADFKPMNKKLLLNMDHLGRFVDNIEGVSFGPVLPNGKKSLLFVADNNFNAFQKSQIFLFELN